jgi:peptidoglycan hydrolase CwlO-like protein
MIRILKLSILVFIIVNPLLTFAQSSESSQDREARLRAELAQVEKEQAETERVLEAQQSQSASISRDIQILTTKIKAAQLNIKAKNIQIEALGKDIGVKQQKIEDLNLRINTGKETLSQIMRKSYEIESQSFPEVILTSENLSEVFIDIDNFQSLQESLKKTFESIRANKQQTENEKDTLSTKKTREQIALVEIESEKKSIERNEIEKKRLLSISKGNEKTYAAELAEKKAKAAQIREALFSLAGGAMAIPFGDALKYAQEAQSATNIRPAFLLAILMQESALGKNVGSCYLNDTQTGESVGVNSGTIFTNGMKPNRDVEPFIAITQSLGFDYKKTLISCPIAGVAGWGGAMGPAQFIPSTWMLFKDRVASVVGVKTPNPWNPEHAFVASSLYLTDLGGTNGNRSREIKAACRYYGSGGSNCTYGNQVMAKATTIQKTMIDPLQGL